MINGFGTPYNQLIANAAFNDNKAQSDIKTNASLKKEPDKLSAIKDAISKNEYKIDMAKTTEAFIKHYA
jgi:anti-sigma28 factor (negative regulator of flagellin synthesis)